MTTNEISTTETAEITAVAEQGAQAAPETSSTTKKASPKKGAPKAKKTAKGAAKKAAKPAAKKDAKPAAKKAPKPAGKKSPKSADNSIPREFSKKAIVLDLLHRKEGATLAEIAKATNWQLHSIRGFISGQLTKKMGLTVESSKNAAGERQYRISN